jgi:serine/threonine protein kinase
MKVIEEALKSKLNINEINDVEIDQEYRRDRFSDLYQIRGLLGVGAFGIVLESLNKLTNEIVALKIITLDSSKNLFQPELIEEEVLKELDHKNIIIFKRILYSNFHVFIEMEKVNGGTLESFIKRQKQKMKEDASKESKFSKGLKTK